VVTRVLPVELEHLEPLVHQDQQDGPEQLVTLEILGHLEDPESRDPREPKGHRARLVRLETKDLQDNRANQVSRVRPAHLVSRVKLEAQVTRDQLVRLARQVPLVQVAHPEHRANKDKRVSKDNRVLSDHPVALGRLGRSEQPGRPELLESLAILDRLDWLELQVPLAQLDKPDPKAKQESKGRLEQRAR
jgi:hypothetical protein